MDNISPDYDSTTVISTSRLTKVFGRLVAVNDLHLQVQRGDVFGFLGPNGSGKTTTIRMLLGLIRPTAGRAILFGMDTAYQLPAILQRIGAIVEMPVFYPYLSGLDNLRVELSGIIKTNKEEIQSLNRNSEKLEKEIEAEKAQIGVYKEALDKANENIKRQNQDIKRQNEELKQLAADRNATVEKYNKLVEQYNDLVKQYEKLQEETAKAAAGKGAEKK